MFPDCITKTTTTKKPGVYKDCVRAAAATGFIPTHGPLMHVISPLCPFHTISVLSNKHKKAKKIALKKKTKLFYHRIGIQLLQSHPNLEVAHVCNSKLGRLRLCPKFQVTAKIGSSTVGRFLWQWHDSWGGFLSSTDSSSASDSSLKLDIHLFFVHDSKLADDKL